MTKKEFSQRYTVEAYLEMERAADVRHEYLDGEIFEMAGETIPHGRISTNIVVARGSTCSFLKVAFATCVCGEIEVVRSA